jgi:hypothetical protein
MSHTKAPAKHPAEKSPKKDSPDVFLSHHGNIGHGIDYSGRGLKGTPPEIMANLAILNATRTVEDGDLIETAYRTPIFSANVDTPAAHTIENTNAHEKLMEAYQASLKTGDPAKVHRAVDKVNQQREAMGGIVELRPPSDFDIIAQQQTPAGEAARFLKAERVRWAEVQAANKPEDAINAMGASPIPWFDTVAAFEAINAFTA